MLLVEADTVVHPLLNTIIYENMPKNPDKKNHLKSFLLGIFILKVIIITINKVEAIEYRINAIENTEKYFSKIFVNTYGKVQNIMVAIAYGWQLSAIFNWEPPYIMWI
jgi:ABC-type phosphate/phosphonate transport system permease subunit